MLLSFVFLLFFWGLYKNTISSKRMVVTVLALLLFSFVTVLDLSFLNNFLNRNFHFSDPTHYYESTRAISFSDIFKNDESSNSFYLIINWIYNQIYNDPFFISFWLKINNVLVILTAYLLITYRIPRYTFFDTILLFNPYLLVTIIRNVRDAYIILFVAMIMVGMGLLNAKSKSKPLLILGISLLAITRPILLVPFLIIYIYKLVRSRPNLKYPILLLIIVGVYYFFFDIFDMILHQALSAMSYLEEDASEFNVLFERQFSFSTISMLFKRIVIGLVSFLFTPHPLNFISNWLTKCNIYGTLGIYTGFDNLLISAGSIYCYLFVIPLVLYYFVNYKIFNQHLFWFVALYIIIYTIAYMGVTDIRNHHFAYFFILVAFVSDTQDRRVTLKKLKPYLFGTLIIFMIIRLISNS